MEDMEGIVGAECDRCGAISMSPGDVTIIHEQSRDEYLYRYACPIDSRGPADFLLRPSNRAHANKFWGTDAKFFELNLEEERLKEGLPLELIVQSPLTLDEISNFIVDLNILDPVQIAYVAEYENS